MALNKSGFTAWLDPAQETPASASLTITPTWYKVTDRGGSYRAEFIVEGSESALWTVLEWLGRKIHIFDPYGSDVWRGKIIEVDLAIAGMTVSLSYSNMFNRVRCYYSFTGPDGAPQSEVTDWADDSLSQSEHGVRELQHSMSDSWQGDAEKQRDEIIERLRFPLGEPKIGTDYVKATIAAAGVFHFLDWKHFEHQVGRFEHPFAPTTEINVGWTLTGTTFAVLWDKLLDYEARLDWLTVGNWFEWSGNSIHDGAQTKVTGDPSGTEQITKTDNEIRFDPSDEIRIEYPKNWTGFRSEEIVRVSGSDYHDNVVFYIEDVNFGNAPGTADPYLDTAGGPITQEDNHDSSNTITVTMGTSVEINDGVFAIDQAMYGESMTFRGLGSEIEQSFVSNFTGDAQLIALSLRKCGTPADTLRIRFYDDSSGSRGSLLWTHTVSPDDMFTTMQRQWIELSSPVSITDGETYYIVIDRTGSESHENLYRVGFTTDNILSPGTLKMKSSTGSFKTFSDMSLSFMIYATEDTVTQMIRIFDECDQFSTGRTFYPTLSAIRTNQWRNGKHKAGTLIEELLDLGKLAGKRFVVQDDPDFKLRIYEEPSPDGKNERLLWADGRVTEAAGGPVSPGILPVAEWIELAELPAEFAQSLGEISPMYVQEAELDLTGPGYPRLGPRTVDRNDVLGSL